MHGSAHLILLCYSLCVGPVCLESLHHLVGILKGSAGTLPRTCAAQHSTTQHACHKAVRSGDVMIVT
jgi:hypothetical protein